MTKAADSMLAIDLATDAVRALDVKVRRSGPTVSAFASQSVEPGSADSLPERHLKAIEQLMATHRFKTRKCVVSMPTSMVVTRVVAIDHSKTQSESEQVRWTLQNCVPFNPKDLIFDFWPVSDPAPDARTHEALVVATQASVVQKYLAGLEKLKLTCTHLDVAPCALATLVALTVKSEKVVGAVSLSETGGYFAIVEGQKVLFWRPFELPAGQSAVSSSKVGLDRVGDEISKCVSHMVGSMQVAPMTELLVFGQGADDKTFTEYLNNRFHMDIRSPSPFESLTDDTMPAELKTSVHRSVAAQFAAAVGLAMQPAGASNHG